MNALELAGIPVAQTAQVGNANLVLNGAGIRNKNLFDIYTCALYLPQKQSSAEAIIADEHERRIKLHFVYSLSSNEVVESLQRGDRGELLARRTGDDWQDSSNKWISFSLRLIT